MSRLALLRAMSAGPRLLTELQRVSSSIPRGRVGAFLNSLVLDGLIVPAGNRYRLTAAGRAAVAATQRVAAPVTEHRPERVVRRAGSEIAATLPSRVGNRLIYPGGNRP